MPLPLTRVPSRSQSNSTPTLLLKAILAHEASLLGLRTVELLVSADNGMKASRFWKKQQASLGWVGSREMGAKAVRSSQDGILSAMQQRAIHIGRCVRIPQRPTFSPLCTLRSQGSSAPTTGRLLCSGQRKFSRVSAPLKRRSVSHTSLCRTTPHNTSPTRTPHQTTAGWCPSGATSGASPL